MREAQWAHRARKGLKYETLAAQLRSEIISGKWTPGTKVPTESELIKETGFSLTTVRKAYEALVEEGLVTRQRDRKSTRLNSSHVAISYAVFCLKKKR